MSKTALCRKILTILLQKSQSLEDLAVLCECSKTTIQRRLQEIPKMFFTGLDVRLKQNRNQILHLIGEDLELLREKLIRDSNASTGVTWHNQTERQTLVLLGLISSPEGFAKLSVLGNFVGVTDATILRDIKSLNKKLSGSPIYSQQGVGTHIQAERDEFFLAILQYFFEHLNPSALLTLLSTCKDHNYYAHDTSIQSCVLKYMSNKVDFEEVQQMIKGLEAVFSVKFSDISYVNIFLFLVLMRLQRVFEITDSNAGLIAALDSQNFDELKDLSPEFINYIVGLDSQLLQYLAADALPEMDWEQVSKDLEVLFKDHVSMSWGLIWESLEPYLQLLHYRKENGYLYWEDMIHRGRIGSVRIHRDLFNELDRYCRNDYISQWLTLDELLFLTEPYLIVDDEVIPVTLVSIDGAHTTNILRKLIEMKCNKIRIEGIVSLRDLISKDHKGKIFISTLNSQLLPENGIIIDGVISKINWPDLQDSVVKVWK